ncbi:MAG: glycosyl hydrolase, partial [Gemmatimonadaceae bacterium]
AYLFAPRPVYRADFSGGPTNGAQHDAGPPKAGNPRSGAVVYYWLASPNDTVGLDFLDDAGRVIRSFSSRVKNAADTGGVEDVEVPRRREPLAPNKAGLNTFAWDLRTPDPASFRGMVLWAGNPVGPRVVPGTYQVRLTVNGHAQTRPFVLRADPRSKATQADLVAQFTLLTRIADTISAANNAIRTIHDVRDQLTARASALGDAREKAAALQDSLTRIENSIYQVKTRASEDPLNYPIGLNDKLAELAAYTGDGSGRPTAQDYAVFTELATRLAAHLRALHTALGSLRSINSALGKAGASPIVAGSADRQ